MDDFIKIILLDFIGNNWSAFESFCENYGVGIAEEVYKALGGQD